MPKVHPAIWRSGRLEIDLAFSIPNDRCRLEILRDQTVQWKIKPSDTTLQEVSLNARTLSMEELTQLCRGAYLTAFQRHVSSACNAHTLKLNSEAGGDAVEVTIEDWKTSLNSLICTQVWLTTPDLDSDDTSPTSLSTEEAVEVEKDKGTFVRFENRYCFKVLMLYKLFIRFLLTLSS